MERPYDFVSAEDFKDLLKRADVSYAEASKKFVECHKAPSMRGRQAIGPSIDIKLKH